MEKAQPGPRCPNCGTGDAPRLIVRGGGPFPTDSSLPDVHLHCRDCGHEWSELPRERWVS
jgi:uncharacterized Zn finger protein